MSKQIFDTLAECNNSCGECETVNTPVPGVFKYTCSTNTSIQIAAFVIVIIVIVGLIIFVFIGFIIFKVKDRMIPNKSKEDPERPNLKQSQMDEGLNENIKNENIVNKKSAKLLSYFKSTNKIIKASEKEHNIELSKVKKDSDILDVIDKKDCSDNDMKQEGVMGLKASNTNYKDNFFLNVKWKNNDTEKNKDINWRSNIKNNDLKVKNKDKHRAVNNEIIERNVGHINNDSEIYLKKKNSYKEETENLVTNNCLLNTEEHIKSKLNTNDDSNPISHNNNLFNNIIIKQENSDYDSEPVIPMNYKWSKNYLKKKEERIQTMKLHKYGFSDVENYTDFKEMNNLDDKIDIINLSSHRHSRKFSIKNSENNSHVKCIEGVNYSHVSSDYDKSKTQSKTSLNYKLDYCSNRNTADIVKNVSKFAPNSNTQRSNPKNIIYKKQRQVSFLQANTNNSPTVVEYSKKHNYNDTLSTYMNTNTRTFTITNTESTLDDNYNTNTNTNTNTNDIVNLKTKVNNKSIHEHNTKIKSIYKRRKRKLYNRSSQISQNHLLSKDSTTEGKKDIIEDEQFTIPELNINKKNNETTPNNNKIKRTLIDEDLDLDDKEYLDKQFKLEESKLIDYKKPYSARKQPIFSSRMIKIVEYKKINQDRVKNKYFGRLYNKAAY